MKKQITYELIEKLVKENPNDYILGNKVREIINSIKYPDDKEISDNRGDKN
jgi:hypothetical protein